MLNLAYADPDGRLIEEDTLRPLVRTGWDVVDPDASTTWSTVSTGLPTAFEISAASTTTSCGPPRRP